MYDIVLIGGGAAGLSVASAAAQLGMKVALIEKRLELGGDCLHTGCIPSKTFIEAAKVVHTARQASQYGIHLSGKVDFAAVMARVHAVIAEVQKHDHVDRFKSLGCDVIFSKAILRSDEEVAVSNHVLRSKHIVIATGSRPRIPMIEGLSSVPYYTSDTLFNLEVLPTKLLILGGGAIALELAQAFARLGTQVTVLESALRFLGHVASEIAEELLAHLRAEGIILRSSVTLSKVESVEGGIRCHGDEGGKGFDLDVDTLLVATGREPNIHELGLEKIGVACSPEGILTNSRLQTSVKNVYAMGDVVAGPHHFTHMASAHASVIVSNIAFGLPKRLERRVVPSVIYTDPELASIGLTSSDLAFNSASVARYTSPLSSNDRAATMGQTKGSAELLCKRGQIVGATLLGPQAGELMAPIALAMHTRMPLRKFAGAIFPYPTLSLWLQQLVGLALKPVVFSAYAKRWVQWLGSWDTRQ